MAEIPPSTGDVNKRRNVLHQCRTLIQRLILMKVMNISVRRAEWAVRTIAQNMRESLDQIFDVVHKQDNLLNLLVHKRLHDCVILKYRTLSDFLQQYDYSLITVRYHSRALRFFKDFASIVTGNTCGEKGKRSIAADVIDNINHEDFAKQILECLLTNIKRGHEAFLEGVQSIQDLCATRIQHADH